VFLFLSIMVASLIVVLGVRAIPSYRDLSLAEITKDPKVLVVSEGLAYAALVVFMVALIRRHGLSFRAGIRWNWPRARWFWFVILGIVLAAVIQPLSNLLPMPKTLPIDRMFNDARSAWLMALFGTFWAPIVEEFFFRGFLYPVLTRWTALLVLAIFDVLGGISALLFSAVTHNHLAFWIGLCMVLAAGVIGTTWLFSFASVRVANGLAVLVTAILFAFIHEQQLAAAWAPLLMVFIVGLVLTLVRAQTKSVASSVLVHMAYNGTLFTMVYFASDHFRHLERVS
jgi:membrane protease YdiL (CAAX protease family)